MITSQTRVSVRTAAGGATREKAQVLRHLNAFSLVAPPVAAANGQKNSPFLPPPSGTNPPFSQKYSGVGGLPGLCLSFPGGGREAHSRGRPFRIQRATGSVVHRPRSPSGETRGAIRFKPPGVCAHSPTGRGRPGLHTASPAQRAKKAACNPSTHPRSPYTPPTVPKGAIRWGLLYLQLP